MCQTKKTIVIVKQAGLYLCLASVVHKMQVDSTSGTLGAIHLTTELSHIYMIIYCLFWLDMHV